MVSIIALALFNLLLLLRPPKVLELILELMPIPFSARASLVAIVVVNIVVSLAFEEWGTRLIANLMEKLQEERRRYRDGKAYKALEGGMR